MKLIPVARLLVSGKKEKLSGKIIEIINVGKEYIIREQIVPANHKSRLVSAVRTLTSIKVSYLIKSGSDLKSLTFKSLKHSNFDIELLKNSLGILSPENVLKRGYTITSLNGIIIKDAEMVEPGDIIDTQFSKGSLKSKVTERKKLIAKWQKRNFHSTKQ
jgi:exodeoxyribonuclease VII large subunit